MLHLIQKSSNLHHWCQSVIDLYVDFSHAESISAKMFKQWAKPVRIANSNRKYTQNVLSVSLSHRVKMSTLFIHHVSCCCCMSSPWPYTNLERGYDLVTGQQAPERIFRWVQSSIIAPSALSQHISVNSRAFTASFIFYCELGSELT